MTESERMVRECIARAILGIVEGYISLKSDNDEQREAQALRSAKEATDLMMKVMRKYDPDHAREIAASFLLNQSVDKLKEISSKSTDMPQEMVMEMFKHAANRILESCKEGDDHGTD